MCVGDEWGTVCDQMWDMDDATVACRQLQLDSTGIGYHSLLYFHYDHISDSVALPGGSFGEGTGSIWLTNIQCTGSEMSLINCTASSSGVNSCTHAQDAGVRCRPG